MAVMAAGSCRRRRRCRIVRSVPGPQSAPFAFMQTPATDNLNVVGLDSNDVTLRFWRNQTRPAVEKLKDAGIHVSLFIDPDLAQVDQAQPDGHAQHAQHPDRPTAREGQHEAERDRGRERAVSLAVRPVERGRVRQGYLPPGRCLQLI